MTLNLKTPKVIVLGDNVNQGSVSDAIKQVLDGELQRGITFKFPKPLIQHTSLDYVNVFETINVPKFVHFDKPKSKFHR